jgi:glycosyltransferase involved in cell wall biosynthesis
MSEIICSIIIPTYNHGKYVERSINSALNQTLKNIEVIVVDDGSTDDTSERVKKFGNSIIYIHKSNSGRGDSRNEAIAISRGKYLQFLDADDTIEETKLEKQAAILEKNDNIALVYSDCSCNDAEGVELENVSYPLGANEDPLPILLKRTLFGIHACLVRREVVIDVGMFDPAKISQEDWDLWLKIAIKGYKFKYIAGNLAHYDQKGSTTVVNAELMYLRTQHMLNKYLKDADFQSLGKTVVNSFIAHQSISLATRAYNNKWWKESRKYFLKAAWTNPKVMKFAYWVCIPKTFIHQINDVLRGRKMALPDHLQYENSGN